MRHLVEFRDEAGELVVGDTVTVEAFEVGQTVKVSGKSKGKGFQGTIKRHNFAAGPKSHGSHNVRAPGSVGASATPSRVFPGLKGPGQMGAKRVTQKGLTIVELHARPQPDARPRLRARARRAAPWRCAPMPDVQILGGRRHARRSTTRCSARRSTARSCTSAWWPSWPRAGGARTRPRRAAWCRGGGAKPWRQKGTGRARAGSSRSPLWTGGGTVFGPSPRHYTVKVNRKARRAALRSVLSIHAERGSIFGLDAAGFTAPSTKQAAELLADRRARLGARRARRATRWRRRSPSATSRACPCWPRRTRAWPTSSAPPRSWPRRRRSTRSRRAPGKTERRAAATTEAMRLMDPSQVIIRPVVSEKSYVLATADKYTFRVHKDAHKTQIKQAVEALFDVTVLEVRTSAVPSKPKRRGYTSGRTREWKKAIVQVRAGDTIPIFQGLEAEL